MDEGIASAVAEWDDRPFEGGAGRLHDLADQGFSGAVTVGNTWLLMINGRAVAVFEEYDGPDGPVQDPGDVEALQGAGTLYDAPHEALPLLYAMVVTGGTERGRYYTGERPLSATHRELEEGGFTGYLELSEEVLSGDYYVVYQDGRSMSVAFIGGERRLRTDDEAFDRAAEEVGIYTVNAVDLDVVELPEPGSPDAGGTPRETATATDSSMDDPATDTPTESAPAGGGARDGDAEPGGSPADPGEPAKVQSDAGHEGQSGEETTHADRGETPPSERRASAGQGDAPAERTGHPGQASSEPTAALSRLEARVDELAAEQERLSAAVAELRDAGAPTPATAQDVDGAGTDLDAGSALADATVLVRYRTDASETLDAIGTGAVTREGLVENLQLEVRTPFDAQSTTVNGQAFRSFLESRLEYRFLEWLLMELPFDVRGSGADTALGRLIEALQSVDRAVFDEAATIADESFDLVVSSREGAPLVVATIEDGVDPPSESGTEAFIQSATRAAEAEPSLAAAVLVTTAYIDGSSLGPAREATRSSLLRRSRQKSIVRHSGGGYHLCLVEAGDSFHLALPEL